MDDVWGPLLGLPHGTTPAAVTTNKNIKMSLVSEQKDLGIIIDNKLTFIPPIQAMVKKANRNLGIIKRTFSYLDKTVF